MSTLEWDEHGRACSVRWHSESGARPPARVVVVDDETSADVAYRLARSGTGLLWRGDYHNGRQLLSAIGRRVDRAAERQGNGRPDKRRGKNPGRREGQVSFAAHRARRAERARILALLIVELDDDYTLTLRRAPDVRLACRDAYGEQTSAMGIALSELLGVIGARQWHEKGVPIPALDDRIHASYGVFSPVRGEYVDLAATTPLPSRAKVAFDLGTGTGVLAAVMARRGVERVIATDINPRAVVCARANIVRLGYAGQVEVQDADLYPAGRADLIVCNPPWLPAAPTSALEQGVYDPDSAMLNRFLDGLAAHLEPDGEGWLILSDLAEHLGLRTHADLMDRIGAADLRVAGRADTAPTHGRATDTSDPLHAARSREVTTLWRLVPVGLESAEQGRLPLVEPSTSEARRRVETSTACFDVQ